jgi:hypothetical protein
MPSYNITGKLGGGKTLYAVYKAFEALAQGRKVAANVDLFPELVLSPWRDQTNVNLFRVPDHPTRAHLDVLGCGNETNDETRNGILILDECGTMLNARNYRDDGRQDLINWFLHARKLGWDLMFISQSHLMIDKQIRDALIEYLVICKRMDRYKVPFLTAVGIKINMPRIHFAMIRYGNTPTAIVSERDFFRGNNLFKAYSTRQIINGGVEGVYSVLSPWHLKGRHMSPRKLAIVASKSAFLGGLVMASVCFMLYNYFKPEPKQSTVVQELSKIPSASGYVSHPDGSVSVIKPDGLIENTRELQHTKEGSIALLSNGSYKLPKASQ